MHRLAHVEPDPDPDRRAGIAEGLGYGGLDGLRARHRTSRRREGEHESVPLALDDRPSVLLGRASDDLVVCAQDVEPASVAEERVQPQRVLDVREGDRHRPIRRRGLRQVRPGLAHGLGDLVDRLGEEEPVVLVGRGDRAVPVHDLPVAVLQMEHAGEAVLHGSSRRRFDLRSRRGPPHRAFAQRTHVVDQAPGVSATELTHLLDPHPSGRLPFEPDLIRIGAEPLEAWEPGEPVAHRLRVAVAKRLEEAGHDALQLFGWLHGPSLTFGRSSRNPRGLRRT
jgi:hypothetical protein